MRNRFGKVVSEQLKNNGSLYFVTADTGNATVMTNSQYYPDRMINVGIAEQNMLGVAAGLALEGKTVIVNSIGNFPTLRCYEQIRDDAAYHHLNVKICTTGGGLSYGPAGVTHHASEDFSVMRAMPNVTCFAPGDPDEVEETVNLMLKTNGTCYMRIGYTNEMSIPKPSSFKLELGKAFEYIDGKKVAIFTAGSILSEGYKAAIELNRNEISTALYSFPTIKPIDIETIKYCSENFEYIITMEENNIMGGFGSAIAEVYSQLPNKKAKVKMFALQDTFPELIGDRQYLLKQYGLTAEDVVRWTLDILQK